MSTISVNNLKKYFRVHKKKAGVSGSIYSLFHRSYEVAQAVNNISFSVSQGELVGFIGPNGAGKTTTLKCLSGVLYPTSGSISVLGFQPFDRKKDFLRQISLVLGQKNQLWWDLPAYESYLLNKEIYEIKESDFKERLSELTKLLNIEDVISIPVRKLSLGQRMKCELVAQLLHAPKLLFLDEPTIGLDVVMQQRIRQFIKTYNKKYNATILLTSHYMQDVKELCSRVIIINKGSILYDGRLSKITERPSAHKRIRLVFDKNIDSSELSRFGTVLSFEEQVGVISVPRSKISLVTAELLGTFSVADITIEDPPIEDVIREIFTQNSVRL